MLVLAPFTRTLDGASLWGCGKWSRTPWSRSRPAIPLASLSRRQDILVTGPFNNNPSKHYMIPNMDFHLPSQMPILTLFSSSHLPIPRIQVSLFSLDILLRWTWNNHLNTNPPIAQLFTNPFATCAHTSPPTSYRVLSFPQLPSLLPSLLIFIFIHLGYWYSNTNPLLLIFSSGPCPTGRIFAHIGFSIAGSPSLFQ